MGTWIVLICSNALHNYDKQGNRSDMFRGRNIQIQGTLKLKGKKQIGKD
jgi:hypothetical protein